MKMKIGSNAIHFICNEGTIPQNNAPSTNNIVLCCILAYFATDISWLGYQTNFNFNFDSNFAVISQYLFKFEFRYNLKYLHFTISYDKLLRFVECSLRNTRILILLAVFIVATREQSSSIITREKRRAFESPLDRMKSRMNEIEISMSSLDRLDGWSSKIDLENMLSIHCPSCLPSILFTPMKNELCTPNSHTA